MPAGAQELKPLPDLDAGFDLALYAGQTDTVSRTYEDLPHVGFEVSLPKTWIERATLGQDFGELTRFDGPAIGDVRPYFSFKRQQVTRENSARNELIAWLLRSGYTLRGFREIDDKNVEALYVMQDNQGDSYAVRCMARIEGPTMQMAEYAVPLKAYNAMRNEQVFAIKSFKFAGSSDTPIEKRIERVYRQSVRFYYPASWLFESEQAVAPNQVVLTLANPNNAGGKQGAIRFALYSAESMVDTAGGNTVYPVDVPALLKDVRTRYVEQRMDISAAIERRKPDLNLPVKFSAMEIYDVGTRISDYDTVEKPKPTQELWLAVFQTGEETPRTFIIELLTPARAQDMYLWSINTRAFEIILKSIQ